MLHVWQLRSLARNKPLGASAALPFDVRRQGKAAEDGAPHNTRSLPSDARLRGADGMGPPLLNQVPGRVGGQGCLGNRVKLGRFNPPVAPTPRGRTIAREGKPRTTSAGDPREEGGKKNNKFGSATPQPPKIFFSCFLTAEARQY